MHKVLIGSTLATVVMGASLGFASPASAATPTPHAPRACHTAYIVYAHVVPEHVVKATAKHSAYTVKAHTVPEHTVKANC